MWGRGQMNKVMEYGEGALESPLSVGPERPCYATVTTWSSYALWKLFEVQVGLQTPQLPQTPYIAYGKGKKKKMKIWILFLQWSKCTLQLT